MKHEWVKKWGAERPAVEVLTSTTERDPTVWR